MAKKPIELLSTTDVSTLSERERFAYYKLTAPALDALFWMKPLDTYVSHAACRMAGDLATAYLDREITRKDLYVRLGRLQAEWRGARNRIDRCMGVAA